MELGLHVNFRHIAEGKKIHVFPHPLRIQFGTKRPLSDIFLSGSPHTKIGLQ